MNLDQGKKHKRSTLLGAALLSVAASTFSLAGLPSGYRTASADEKGTVEEAIGLNLSQNIKSQFLKISITLARLGLKDHAEKILDLYLSTGVSKSSKLKASKDVSKAIRRASKKPLLGNNAEKFLKSSKKQISDLVGSILDSSKGRELSFREQAARVVLALDSTNRESGQILGYIERHGNWISPKEADRAKKQDMVFDWISEARALDFSDQIETGKADNEIVSEVCNRKPYFARYKDKAGGSLEIWSCDLSPEKLKDTCQDVLRTFALAHKMLSGEYKTGFKHSAARIFFSSKEDRLKAQQIAQKNGNLYRSSQNLQMYTENDFHRDTRGYTVSQSREPYLSSVIVHDVSDYVLNDNYRSYYPQLSIGLFNAAHSYITNFPLPGSVGVQKEGSEEGGSHSVSPVDKDKLEYYLKIGSASAYGSRLCARFLDEHGLLPPWSDSFLKREESIGGLNRLKSTHIVEFIAAEGKLGELLLATRGLEPGDKEGFKRVLGEVLGYGYVELEAKFRTWLRAPRESLGGILQQLDKYDLSADDRSAQVKTPAEIALDILQEIRKSALKPGDILPMIADPELNLGVQLHSKYLVLNPGEFTYPDVHTEKPNLPGFTRAGRASAAKSVISRLAKTPKETIDSWMATFLHRSGLLRPNIYAIGFGSYEHISGLDCVSGILGASPETEFICWPPNNAKDVQLNAELEMPNPLPGFDMNAMGFPITVIVTKSDIDLSKIDIKLYKGDPRRGRLVDCHFISPSNNKQPEVVISDEFCLMRKGKHLDPNTTYTYVVSLGGKKLVQNSFTTGRNKTR